MIVAKFGGTSVSSVQRIKTICKITRSELKRNPVIIVSALSGITDLLLSLSNLPKNELTDKITEIKRIHLNLINQFWKKTSDRKEILSYMDSKIREIEELCKTDKFNKSKLDKLVSYGEMFSSFIVSKALNTQRIPSRQVIATEIIITNDSFGSAEFLREQTKENAEKILKPLIASGIVPVVTGFIGSTVNGRTTTLGRGGSDYTASIIGLCLDAEEVQIWTDVNGVYTADPRMVKNPKHIPAISFREASELATFGARVLHPRTIKPAIKANIPVKVLNTFNPKAKGTLITDKVESKNLITAIAFKKRVTLINIYSTDMLLSKGYFANIFKIFTRNNISINLVGVSEVSLSVTLDNDENLEKVQKEISEFASISASKKYGTISLVGEAIANSPVILKEIFNLLAKENIPVKMISLGATDINISIVVESERLETAVKILHDKLLLRHRVKLIPAKTKQINRDIMLKSGFNYKKIVN